VGFRLQPPLLVLLVVALCGGLILGLGLLRGRHLSAPRDLAGYLPAAEGIVVGIDFESLRASGVLSALAGNRVTQEPDYQAFVMETAFDYEQDLDYALAWFGKDTVCMLLRGRFNWSRLTEYAKTQSGICSNSFCRLPGSTPQRNISFFPLRRNVMALAMSSDAWAAGNLSKTKPERRLATLPGQPFWLLVPASALADADRLPEGARPFAKAVQAAERIVLSVGVSGANLEVLLDATCRSPEGASLLKSQLEDATRLLKELLGREKKSADPRDLGWVLASGTFHREDMHVLGRWPVERGFLEGILGGSQ
jgi:hypothetical protein